MPSNNASKRIREDKREMYLYVVAQKSESGLMEDVGQTSPSLCTATLAVPLDAAPREKQNILASRH